MCTHQSRCFMDVFKQLRENNFVAEVLEKLQLVHEVLVERKKTLSLTVKRLLVEKRKEGYEDVNNFLSEVANRYERCL